MRTASVHGPGETGLAALLRSLDEGGTRTVYLFDVRTAQEYGAQGAWGGVVRGIFAAPGDEPDVLDALDTATSWESWNHLTLVVGRLRTTLPRTFGPSKISPLKFNRETLSGLSVGTVPANPLY